MASSTIPSDKLNRYDNLIAGFPYMERKGKTTPYTSTNTYMFSFLSKDGRLALRFGAEKLNTLIEDSNFEQAEQHGRVLKDFVWVPETLFSTLEEVKGLLQQSFEHTQSLKPKKK